MTEIERMSRLLCEAVDGLPPDDKIARQSGIRWRWQDYETRAERLTAAGLTLIRREPTEADLERVAREICENRMQRHSLHSHCCQLAPGACVHKMDMLADARAAWRAAVEGGE